MKKDKRKITDNPESCYEIIVDYRCNAACSFCSQESGLRKNPSLKFEFGDIARRIVAAKRAGYQRIGFTGGEPLLRRDLVDIVTFAKRCGFRTIRIQTNGMLLTDKKYAMALVRAGVTYFKISIESHIADIHDMLVGTTAGLKKIMKGIDILNNLSVRIGMNIVATKQNYKHLAEQVEFFTKEKRVTSIVVIYPVFTGNMLKNKETLAVSYAQLKPELDKIVMFSERNGLREEILFLNIPPCVMYNGASSDIGNLIGLERYDTIVDAPTGKCDLDDNRTSANKKTKECKKCLYESRCPGIDAAYLDMFGEKEITAVSKKKIVFKSKERGKTVVVKSSIFNFRERCFMEVLKKKNPATSDEIIEIARAIPLCNNCSDGNEVIKTGRGLVARKLATMTMIKGKYYWASRP